VTVPRRELERSDRGWQVTAIVYAHRHGITARDSRTGPRLVRTAPGWRLSEPAQKPWPPSAVQAARQSSIGSGPR